MPVETASFEQIIKREADNLIAEELVKLHRVICIEAFKRIVQKTPVDIGRARGNWQLNIGIVKTDQLNVEDKAGSATINAAITKLLGLGPFQVVWISNNLDYIEKLEDGLFVPPDPGPSKDPRPGRRGRILVRGGFSTQAPQGMVKVTLQELDLKYT